MSRLIVVSNRVAPITEGEPTAGGLAAGVLDALRQQDGLWFGWSGEVADDRAAPAHAERAVGPIRLHTVDLSRRDYEGCYRGFANGTLANCVTACWDGRLSIAPRSPNICFGRPMRLTWAVPSPP